MNIPRSDLRNQDRLACDHRRMHDCIQLFHTSVGEGDASQRAAIQLSIGEHNSFAKVSNDVLVNGVTGLHQFTPDGVRLQHVRSKHSEDLRHGGLSASQAAGETNAQHDGYFFSCFFSEEMPRLSFAAVTVFCISIAIVSAPTPPGTGV